MNNRNNKNKNNVLKEEKGRRKALEATKAYR